MLQGIVHALAWGAACDRGITVYKLASLDSVIRNDEAFYSLDGLRHRSDTRRSQVAVNTQVPINNEVPRNMHIPMRPLASESQVPSHSREMPRQSQVRTQGAVDTWALNPDSFGFDHSGSGIVLPFKL